MMYDTNAASLFARQSLKVLSSRDTAFFDGADSFMGAATMRASGDAALRTILLLAKGFLRVAKPVVVGAAQAATSTAIRAMSIAVAAERKVPDD